MYNQLKPRLPPTDKKPYSGFHFICWDASDSSVRWLTEAVKYPGVRCTADTGPWPDCQRWGVCPAQNAICCPSLRHCGFSAGATLKGTFTQAHTLDVFAIQYFHTQPHHYAGTRASLERACAFTDRQIAVRD